MTPARIKVGKEEAGKALLDLLAERLDLSRNKAKQILDRREVFVNGRRVWMARHTLAAGDEVDLIAGARPAEVDRSVILFEDPGLVIADKPAGVLSNGPGSMEEQLRAQLQAPALAAVHRLDRDTSGCLILARNAADAGKIIALFGDHKIVKLYHVIVAGRMPPGERTVDRPVDNMAAVTHLRVLDTNDEATHLMVKIDTGRTHQIRKHLLSLGHTVLGDKTYGTSAALSRRFREVPRQMLHAFSISFHHPETGAPVRVVAPLPPDFKTCLKRLKLT